MPFLVSISDGLFWDFRYDYNEEVRASLGPGVYNRDPVAGYHVVNVEGAIRSFELGLSTSIGDKAKVGLIFENFYEDLALNKFGLYSNRHTSLRICLFNQATPKFCCFYRDNLIRKLFFY